MQMYIGTKQIIATPMDRLAYTQYRGWELPADEDGSDEGYLVEYLDGGQPNHPDHKGYISWSPKDVFERTYLEVGDSSRYAPHQVRVVCEAKDLSVKLEKLLAFQGQDLFKQLPQEEQQRLRNQAGAMSQYLTILQERISNF
jgi:hypothetical protein